MMIKSMIPYPQLFISCHKKANEGSAEIPMGVKVVVSTYKDYSVILIAILCDSFHGN